MKWNDIKKDEYPAHKEDIIFIMWDKDDAEWIIASGYYDGRTNTFEPYGFESVPFDGVRYWRYWINLLHDVELPEIDN